MHRAANPHILRTDSVGMTRPKVRSLAFGHIRQLDPVLARSCVGPGRWVRDLKATGSSPPHDLSGGLEPRNGV